MPWQPPRQLVDRARQLADGTLVAPEPHDAATVMLIRDGKGDSAGAGGLEVHLQRRVATMAFAPGMHVFPGGRVDPADASIPVDLPDTWPHLLGADPAQARAIVVAACRETFEEAGVLLTDGPVPPAVAADVDAARRKPFADLGVTPSTQLMRPWARWITPEFEPRRYDTRFFVAALPAGQLAAGDDAGGEADATVWIAPADALALHRDGELAMMPPTVFTISELAEYADTDAVLTAAGQRDCRPVLPRLVVDGTDAELLLGDE